jgi:hypothetical protein
MATAARAAKRNDSFSSGSTRGSSSRQKLKGIGRFLFFGTITFIGLLNIQPWVAVARQMKSAITFVPFLKSLIQIPYLGGCLLWLSSNDIALSLLATGLWAITQWLELSDWPNKKQRALIYCWEFLVIFLHFPPYEGGYTALMEDFPFWSPDLVSWGNLVLSLIAAFAFETIYKVLKK